MTEPLWFIVIIGSCLIIFKIILLVADSRNETRADQDNRHKRITYKDPTTGIYMTAERRPPRSGPLQTIEAHNAERERTSFAKAPGNPSGVACPKCQAELYYFFVSSTHARTDGLRPVFCRSCNHEDLIR